METNLKKINYLLTNSPKIKQIELNVNTHLNKDYKPIEIQGYQRQYNVEEKPEEKTIIAAIPQQSQTLTFDKENFGKNISTYLQQKLNLNANQAAGILTHIMAESGGNFAAVNKDEAAGKNSAVKPSEAGTGLIQWTGTRANNLRNYLKDNNIENSTKAQLDFMVDEIQHKYKNYLDNLRKTNTAEEAADLTYVSYVAATNTFKNYDPKIISKKADYISKAYQAKRAEMGHKPQDSRMKRRNNAHLYIFAKHGGQLPKIDTLSNILIKLKNGK